MKCQNCQRDNPDPKPVCTRLPGRPANNGRSHAYSTKTTVWCGLCRGNYMGKWKWPPKPKKSKPSAG